MKKFLDVMIDTETLSRRPSAAIIQIAAKPFCLDDAASGKYTPFNSIVYNINATTCAMYGMDFNTDTVRWWSKNTPANEEFKAPNNVYDIKKALEDFAFELEVLRKENDADDLIVWCQGTDFDITLLREAYRHVFGSEDKVPWKYRNVRDARTYFLEAVRIFAPDVEKPYDLIKSDGVQHTALADCEWSIKAVQWAYHHYDTWNEMFKKDDGEG